MLCRKKSCQKSAMYCGKFMWYRIKIKEDKIYAKPKILLASSKVRSLIATLYVCFSGYKYRLFSSQRFFLDTEYVQHQLTSKIVCINSKTCLHSLDENNKTRQQPATCPVPFFPWYLPISFCGKFDLKI